jgi:ribosomal protein S17
MGIKYEYESTCCKHFYIEVRNADDAQVHTKCNNCFEGEYVLIAETVDESHIPPETPDTIMEANN